MKKELLKKQKLREITRRPSQEALKHIGHVTQMFYKAFQILLVTFVVIFTAVGVVLLVFALTPILFPGFSSHGGERSFVFSVRARTLKLILASIVFLLVAGAYAIGRRRMLR